MGFLHLGTTVRWGKKTQVPDSSEVQDGCTQANSQPPYSSLIVSSPAIRQGLSECENGGETPLAWTP